MNTNVKTARYLLAVPITLLAAALAYFSYAIIYTVDRAPEIIVAIDKTSTSINRVTDEIGTISEQIPPIIEQVDAIQKKLPLILAEIEANRKLVPGVLEEVAKIREQIPDILKETRALREELPAVLKEMESYRLLLPEVIKEVEAVRKMVPPTLDRADKLIADAKGAGQQASEGAVKGVFTGIIKTPFSWMGSLGRKIFPKSGLTESDHAAINAQIQAALEADTPGSLKWENSETRNSGEVTVISEQIIDGRTCRNLRVTAYKKSTKVGDSKILVCKNQDGVWNLVE